MSTPSALNAIQITRLRGTGRLKDNEISSGGRPDQRVINGLAEPRGNKRVWKLARSTEFAREDRGDFILFGCLRRGARIATEKSIISG